MRIKELWPCVLLVIGLTIPTLVFADEEDDDTTTTATSANLSQDAIGNMLLQAVSLMGIPYRWGGNTPQTGMDCSGFIRYVFQKSLGITLPRTAAEIAKVGKRVSLDALEPGDLLFFNNGHRIDHMGMFIGGGKFIQSPHTGATIQISPLNSYWKARISGAKRIVQENQDDSGNTTLEEYQDIKTQTLPSGHRHKHRHKVVTNNAQ